MSDSRSTAPRYTGDDYIPMAAWGKDHHCTLAYVDTVMVDCAGFQVGADARMRSSRRNFRVMSQQCARPRRVGNGGASLGVAMGPEHGTRLNNGQTLPGHDDWACLQDAANAGLFTVGAEDIEPGVTLHFSDLGRSYISALRAFKAVGGQFAQFRFEAPSTLMAEG